MWASAFFCVVFAAVLGDMCYEDPLLGAATAFKLDDLKYLLTCEGRAPQALVDAYQKAGGLASLMDNLEGIKLTVNLCCPSSPRLPRLPRLPPPPGSPCLLNTFALCLVCPFRLLYIHPPSVTLSHTHNHSWVVFACDCRFKTPVDAPMSMTLPLITVPLAMDRQPWTKCLPSWSSRETHTLTCWAR